MGMLAVDGSSGPAVPHLRVVRALLRSQWVSAWRTFCGDGRYRMAWLIVLALDVGLGWWGAGRLGMLVASERVRGSEALVRELSLAILAAWAVVGVLGFLSARQYVLARQPNDLLFALPIAPAARWRSLWIQLTLGGLGNWCVLGTASFGMGLLPGLGLAVVPWLVLYWAGCACTAGVVLALLVLWLGGRRGPAAGLLAAAGAYLAAVVLLLPSTATAWGGSAAGAVAGAALAATVPLALLIGPLASGLGRRCEAAYFASQANALGCDVSAGLAARTASRLLLRKRSLAGGLLLRELTVRSRHWTNWLRLLAVAACAAAYPWLSQPLHSLADGGLIPLSFAVGLIYLTVFDSATSPIGAEGDRLDLFLTMPITWRSFLAARWEVFYACYGLPGLLFGLLFCTWDGMPLGTAGLVAGALAMMFAGMSSIFAWGSAWDAAPDRPFATGFQAIMEEDVPFTPQRMVLSMTAFLLLAAQVAWLLREPSPLGLAGLAAINGLVLIAAWRAAVALTPRR